MNFVKKIVAATAISGVLATAGFGGVQAGDSSLETPAFQQDEDLLTPHDRVLSRNPHLYPEWTWMTESQAILLLKAAGFSDVLRLEKAGSSWRGKATNDELSYHVAIDRYARVIAHLDKKSRESYAVAENTKSDAGKGSKTIASVVPQDEDLLTPHDRVLSRNPHLYPEWTWMTGSQAILLLKARGFSDVFRLEKVGSSWRGKARKDYLSYHVAIDRYARVIAHLDKKSRESYAVAENTKRDAAKGSKTIQATLNGLIAIPIRQKAPTVLTPGKPILTMMGEVGWTWMKEKDAKLMLKAKGYANIVSLRRDARGIWRAKALRDGLALNVAVDVYGNVETHPVSLGGLAQMSRSD